MGVRGRGWEYGQSNRSFYGFGNDILPGIEWRFRRAKLRDLFYFIPFSLVYGKLFIPPQYSPPLLPLPLSLCQKWPGGGLRVEEGGKGVG